jgi:hypothetical protein
MFELNIPAAVLAAMGLGVALSMSLRSQMRMQDSKDGSVPATSWFTRITQACLSFTILLVIALVSRLGHPIGIDAFMFTAYGAAALSWYLARSATTPPRDAQPIE